MVEARELVTVCRQIGGMLEAGVDILRVTLVVRAQTNNPRLLEAFGEIEHSLRIGASVSEALEGVPDVFSPFAVSLVQEGEAKRDIAGAFLRIADFLQQEEEAAPIFASRPPAVLSSTGVVVAAPSALPVEAIAELAERVRLGLFKALALLTVWMLALTGIWWSVAMGILSSRWQNVTLCAVTALFGAGAAGWLYQRPIANRGGSQNKEEASAASLADGALVEEPVPVAPDPRGAALPARTGNLPSVGAAAASLRAAREGGLSARSPSTAEQGEDVGDTSKAAAPNGAPLNGVPTNGTAPGRGAASLARGVGTPSPSLARGEELSGGATSKASGTPLATSDALAAARQIARRKYGALADAADVMSVQPDVYEMDEAETLNEDELGAEGGLSRISSATGRPPVEGTLRSNGSGAEDSSKKASGAARGLNGFASGASGKASPHAEADFD